MDLDKITVDDLKACIDDCPKGKRTRQNMKALCGLLYKYAKYTPHSCRHTFATLMKRVSGADKDKLELMGHTSTEMLRHYQDVAFDDLRKIIDAI